MKKIYQPKDVRKMKFGAPKLQLASTPCSFEDGAIQDVIVITLFLEPQRLSKSGLEKEGRHFIGATLNACGDWSERQPMRVCLNYYPKRKVADSPKRRSSMKRKILSVLRKYLRK